jgi:hypothetical protein
VSKETYYNVKRDLLQCQKKASSASIGLLFAIPLIKESTIGM